MAVFLHDSCYYDDVGPVTRACSRTHAVVGAPRGRTSRAAKMLSFHYNIRLARQIRRRNEAYEDRSFVMIVVVIIAFSVKKNKKIPDRFGSPRESI